jgi:hypothetical protein
VGQGSPAGAREDSLLASLQKKVEARRADKADNGHVGATQFTDDLRDQLQRDLDDGVLRAEAARRAGITPRTLRRWLASGRVRRPAPPRQPPEVELPLTERLEQVEPGLVAAIARAAQGGNWKAAAWLL